MFEKHLAPMLTPKEICDTVGVTKAEEKEVLDILKGQTKRAKVWQPAKLICEDYEQAGFTVQLLLLAHIYDDEKPTKIEVWEYIVTDIDSKQSVNGEVEGLKEAKKKAIKVVKDWIKDWKED